MRPSLIRHLVSGAAPAPPRLRASFSPEITTNDLTAIVSHLASDELEGRLSGSPGAERAADYIAAQMQRIGLQPVGTNDESISAL